MVYRILDSKDRIREKLYVCKDFPNAREEMGASLSSKYKGFKESIHRIISGIDNRNKYIFILNSEIYSSYYLLSESS